MENKYFDIINTEIDSIINKNAFGLDFKFVEGQRETVLTICNSYLEWLNNESEIDTIILAAPTGYGKSIISMFTSKVLQQLKYHGYILTIDLMLQQQYEKDFARFNIGYASIKGADNYKCHVNSESFSNGECHSMNLSYKQLTKLKCYHRCAYLQARNKAIKSPVSLINYSYWLMQRNNVSDKFGEEDAPFKRRNFVFFDECHKIDDIVQNHFAIKITNNFPNYFESINNILYENNYILETKYNRTSIMKIVEVLNKTDKKDILLEKLEELKDILFIYVEEEEAIREHLKQTIKDSDFIPADWAVALSIINEFSSLRLKLFDYINVINETGLNTLIKRQTDEHVEFVTLREDFLIKKYVLDRAGFKIFMSATLGDINKFAQITGIKKAKLLKLKNRFSYEKSPIFYMKSLRLDYKNKAKNLDTAIKVIDHIIMTKHMNDNGIIHTGSYEFTRELMAKSKFRHKFIDYKNENKRARVRKFLEAGTGKILIGPSILEGLDLYDDLCRFQIFLKIPYPSLNDPLVKAKLNESQVWYDWKTSISIIQGSNRGIRNTEDHSSTIILDSCFLDLLKRNLFDKDFTDRLRPMEK